MTKYFPSIRQARSIGRVTGAGAGWFDPTKIAEQLYGNAWKPYQMKAEAMLYLFRRFGYPIGGWDEYKQGCSYTLTTPMKGVYLTSGLGSFGYLLSESLDKRVRQERYAPGWAWDNALKAWAQEEKGVIVCTMGDFMSASRRPKSKERKRIDEAWKMWTGTLPADTPDDDETIKQLSEQFYNFKIKEDAELVSIYQEIKPRPSHPQSKQIMEELGATSLSGRIQTALETAIRELLRPVTIRDTLYTIMGYTPYEQTPRLKIAEPWVGAGYGAGSLTTIYENETTRNKYYAIMRHLRKTHGDIHKGIEVLYSQLEITEEE